MTRDQMIAIGIDPKHISKPLFGMEQEVRRKQAENIPQNFVFKEERYWHRHEWEAEITKRRSTFMTELQKDQASQEELDEEVTLGFLAHFVLWSNVLVFVVFAWSVFAAIAESNNAGEFVITVALGAVLLLFMATFLMGTLIFGPAIVTSVVGLNLIGFFGAETFLGGVGGVLAIGGLGVIYLGAQITADWNRARYWRALWSNRTPSEKAFGSAAPYNEKKEKGYLSQRKA